MARADFFSALVLVALGGGALLEALRMPRFEAIGANPYSVPGLVPGVLGAVIAVLGLFLLVRSVRQGGHRRGAAAAGGDAGGARLWLALVLTLGYAALLVGTLPFALATGLFVFAFIVLFERPESAGRRVRRTLSAAVEALIVAAVVTHVFEEFFYVRLP
ncbi:MAG: tripartite tricarboxylate transporter TctB family protein [Burkholderiales bacterium]|nr:tripartite tricarboxylate transporter TctB family protein [Burkholderiales bacterium]